MRAATLRSIGWALLAGSACGPSLTNVHEGTVRFEHCYRIDLQPEVAASQRRSCWYTWVSSYTVGQPRDRIEYAENRVRALDGGDTSCQKLAIGSDTPAAQRQFYLVVPAPTSVHAPPPPVATVVEASRHAPPGDEVPGAKTREPPAPPDATCANACEKSWSSCIDACPSPAPAECAQCKPAYTQCMRSCFQ
jgi:hypothetical protein